MIVIIKYLEVVFPLNKVNNRWPAIILAVSRIVKVPGRIKLLIDSIKTINGIKILGVPLGIIWENMKLVLFNHPNVIKLIHSGIENVKEKIKWLDLVKIYGNNPIKLFKKIRINREINKIELKVLNFGVKIILNSLYKVSIINLKNLVSRDLYNQ